MIVRANGGYETNPLYPSTNWYTDEPENYVIDESTIDGQALAEKIKSHYPYYNLVVENGWLRDVTPYTPEPIPEPEPVKTPEQLKLEQLERDNESLMLAVADLYEQVINLQGGS